MGNELTKAPAGESATKNKLALAATKLADFYLADLTNLNAAVGMPINEETKRCAVNLLLELCSTYGAEAVRNIPTAQMVNALQFVTLNGLDVFAGQVFLDTRKDKNGNIVSIKATPQGNAYEIMVRRFGVDVKKLHTAKIVHEGDEFQMPQFDGLKMTNVIFKPTLKGLDGKAIAVYYLIEKTDGTLDMAIATREGVAKNLMAQILNATLRDSSVNRHDLMKHMEGKTLDELLTDPTLERFISPAYKSPASRESMIVQKMKKNALLHYTRDLGSKAYAAVADQIEGDENSDMVAGKNVVYDASGEPNAEPKKKIADFSVTEDGEVKTEATEVPEKSDLEPATATEEAKADKVAEQPKNEPEKAKEAMEAKEAKEVKETKEAESAFDFFDTEYL